MRENRQESLAREAEIIQACIGNVQRALEGNAVEYAPPQAFRGGDRGLDDGQMTLHGPWGSKTFVIEVKRVVSAEAARALLAKWSVRHPRPLLLTEYVNPAVSVFLREQGVNFADAAGNLYLREAPLFIWLQGHRRRMPTHRPTRPFQTAGLKILSVLMWEPEMANATYRVLAERAGVSLGAIVPVFEDLTRDGFLRATGSGRQLIHQQELLEQWVQGYAGHLFPRLILKTCRLAHHQRIDVLAEELRGARFAGPILLGGEWAAGMATAHLRPTRAAIHLATEEQGAWMKRLKLIPDPEGDVDLLQLFGDGNRWRDPPTQFEGIPCANPVLIYGELLRGRADDRLRETADMLFQKFIAPRFGGGE